MVNVHHLVHRHPTGDPSPSSKDISITIRLKEAGEIMGIIDTGPYNYRRK